VVLYLRTASSERRTLINLAPLATPNRPDANSYRFSETRLHGRWLLFARTIWVALAIFSLGILAIATFRYVIPLSTLNTHMSAILLHPDSSISGYTAFYSRFILLFSNYFALDVLLTNISSLIWIAVGIVIFWRKSDDWVALLVAFGLITYGITFSPQIYTMYVLAGQSLPWRLLITFIDVLGWGCIGLFFYLFPNGHCIPRWIRWIAPLYIVYLLFQSLPESSLISVDQWPLLLLAPVQSILLLAPVFSQIYRYRHMSNRVEKQQTKWVVFGIVLTMLGDVLLFLPPVFFAQFAEPGLPRSIYALVSECLFPVLLPLIPITIGIALLRYRLWDIDILINRALVYGSLTAILFLIYFGLIIAIQFLMRGLFNQTNEIALVCSTLAIAALFQPLRRRIQIGIDRRFYRTKYDAARILKAFSATLRNEVDLNTLTEQLTAVVEESMQPAHIFLWLHPSASTRERETRILPRLDESE